MKYFKKAFLWICISLAIQCVIFYLADRYIMIKEDVRIYKIGLKNKEENARLDINIKANSSWKDINCSYNGKYISYTAKNKLYVYDISSNVTKEIPFGDNQQLAYYTWIPQRQRLLIIEKKDNNAEVIFSISYFDATNNEKRNVKDISHETKSSTINDVEVSLLTGIIYINIITGDTKSNLYRIDISENVLSIDTENMFIDKLSLVESMDRLLYEDKLYNKIFYMDFPSNEGEEIVISHDIENTDNREATEAIEGTKSIEDKKSIEGTKSIEVNDKLVKKNYIESLLGSNDLGEVYVGKNENGYITAIYNTEGDLELKNWTKKKLEKPIKKEKIYICENDGFYIIYEDEQKVMYYNKKGEIEKKLLGKILCFYDKGYIYINSENRIINEQVLE